MKAVLISIKPKWVAKILNGEKTIEIRKNKGLYKAIQTLISMYGYVDFYGYCTKDKETIAINPYGGYAIIPNKYENEYFNGKVAFKFRCYKVEEIFVGEENNDYFYKAKHLTNKELRNKSCLSNKELLDYLNLEDGTAIHISNLEIFDRPKELSEFYKVGYLEERYAVESHLADIEGRNGGVNESYADKLYEELDKEYQLTKAPRNFCYVEVE